MTENEILNKLSKRCGEPQILELIFYNKDENEDKCLGKLIKDIISSKDIVCGKCNSLNKNHLFYVYKNSGRVKINYFQDEITEKLNEYTLENPGYSFPIKNGNLNSKTVNHFDNIYMYGYCNICHAVVTPLSIVHREIFNFSFAKFMKIILYNHKLHNRTDEDFNIFISSKYPFVKNNCNHLINKDISRVFLTAYGAIKFTFENSSIYIVEPCAIVENKETMLNSFYDETQLSSFTDKSAIALKYLKNYYNHLNDKLDNLYNVFINDDIVKNFLFVLREKVSKQNEKISELINFCGNFPPFKTEEFFRMCLIKKKLNARVIQIKIIFKKLYKNIKLLEKYYQNKINATLQKIKDSPITLNNEEYQESRDFINIIPLTNNLTGNSLSSQNIRENSFASPINQYGSNTFFPTINLNNNNNIFNENNELIPIDKLFCIYDVFTEIKFFDDKHTKLINEIDVNDMGSIIVYTLTSDEYREAISSKKFKLLSIKCERKIKKEESKSTRQSMFPSVKSIKNFTSVKNQPSNINLPSISVTNDERYILSPKNSNNFLNDFDNKSVSNNNLTLAKSNTFFDEDLRKEDLISSKPIEDDFIKTEDEKVYETNLLFDPNKNSYTDDISDNQNIQLQLETELLSDVTSNFSITFNNSQLMNFISNSTIDIIKKKDSSEFDDKNKDLIIGENMKVLNEELNRINSDLLKLNEMNEIQKNKKKRIFILRINTKSKLSFTFPGSSKP